MANNDDYGVKESALTASAIAIQSKSNLSNQILWDDSTGFADAIYAIPSGGQLGTMHNVEFIYNETTDGTVLQTVEVPHKGDASFTGTLPTVTGKYFVGWNPRPVSVTSDMQCIARYSYGQIDTGEITDTWETICENHGADYPIGSYKGLILIDSNGNNLGNVNMQKVYEGEDISTSTWVAKTALSATRGMHSANDTNGGYPAMELESYVNNTLFAALPAELKESIVPVMKYSASLISSNWSYAHASQESLWIPSAREVGLSIETNGPVYSQIYSSSSARVKNQGPAGGTVAWWLRSTSDGSHFRVVNSSGAIDTSDAMTARGVVIGFCL